MTVKPTKPCLWNRVVDFCNNVLPGGLINRKELLPYCGDSPRSANSSVDPYRRILSKLGYLETVRPGVYRLVQSIPVNSKMIKARNIAYPKKEVV